MLLKNAKLIFLLVSLLISNNAANKVNFCDKQATCVHKGLKHTICILKHNCSPSPQCRDFEAALLSDAEKKILLDTHNKLRSLVATGKALPGLGGKMLPTASDMAEMVWDKELEFIAQCWANQCAGGHDRCRSKSDGTPAGQNLAFTSGTELGELIEGFYNEINGTTEKDITIFGNSKYKIGHFTQLAYYNSSQLGCGRSKYYYPPFKEPTLYLVCNYAMVGNILGEKIYTKGKPCGSCPGKCHSTYTGLCKTPPSSSVFPDICSHSANVEGCKPFLKVDTSQKSSAQKLSHGLYNSFGTSLSIAAIIFTTLWLHSVFLKFGI